MWKHSVVAALMFGTTDSGHAFSFQQEYERDPLKINVHSWWTDIGFSLKTPACILLNKKKQFQAFGYEAQEIYAELVADEKQDDYYFFDRFTMSLYNNENVTRDMVLKDKTGKQCSAMEVFTLSIKYLVDCLMKRGNINDIGIRDDEIIWVLAVPSAWTDSRKQLMRESAEKAGLYEKNVLIVTEFEAAFIYCHYVPTTRLQGSKDGIMIKEPGTKSMVVDLGAKTADITVLQTTYNGQLKVLCRATGDDCGSASVDDRFFKVLEEIVGGNVIEECKRKDPAGWLDLIREVRIKIRVFTTSITGKTTFRLPFSLTETCEYLHGKDLKSVIDSSSYGTEITAMREKLRIEPDLIIKLFTQTTDSIIMLMKNTLSDKSTNGLSNIVMVGGFSECPMIEEAVQKAFPNNQIIIPVDAGSSVLKGAVLFGQRSAYTISVKGVSLDDDDDDGCIGK